MIYNHKKKIQNRYVMISKSIMFDAKKIDGCDFQVSEYLIYFVTKDKPFSCQNAIHFDVKFPWHLIGKKMRY